MDYLEPYDRALSRIASVIFVVNDHIWHPVEALLHIDMFDIRITQGDGFALTLLFIGLVAIKVFLNLTLFFEELIRVNIQKMNYGSVKF